MLLGLILDSKAGHERCGYMNLLFLSFFLTFQLNLSRLAVNQVSDMSILHLPPTASEVMTRD